MTRPVVYIALQQFCEADDRPRQLLLEAGCEVRANTLGRRLTAEDLREVLRDVDAVIAGVEPYDAALFARLPRLRCISRCGVGTDAIDLDAARRHRVRVYTTGDDVVEPVAQMTVAMILALARHLPQCVTDSRAGVWKKRTGALLDEWTIGLLGFGRIGRMVARYLQPFGTRILATDPRAGIDGAPEGVTITPIEALLAESDLISLHAGRSPDEGPLLGAAEFARIKPGCRLVNTSRGYLVDEQALEEALRTGRVAAAALDVFAEEPYRGPLASMPQVLCTPHVASLTRRSRAAMEARCAANVVEWLAEPGARASIMSGVAAA